MTCIQNKRVFEYVRPNIKGFKCNIDRNKGFKLIILRNKEGFH